MLIGVVGQIFDCCELKWHEWRSHFGCRKRYEADTVLSPALVLNMRRRPKGGWALYGPRAMAAAGIFTLRAFLVAITDPGLVGVGGRAYSGCRPWGPACELTSGPGGRPVHSLGYPGPALSLLLNYAGCDGGGGDHTRTWMCGMPAGKHL